MQKIRLKKGNSNDFLLSKTSLIGRESKKNIVVGDKEQPTPKSSYDRSNLSAKQKERRRRYKERMGDS